MESSPPQESFEIFKNFLFLLLNISFVFVLEVRFHRDDFQELYETFFEYFKIFFFTFSYLMLLIALSFYIHKIILSDGFLNDFFRRGLHYCYFLITTRYSIRH